MIHPVKRFGLTMFLWFILNSILTANHIDRTRVSLLAVIGGLFISDQESAYINSDMQTHSPDFYIHTVVTIMCCKALVFHLISVHVKQVYFHCRFNDQKDHIKVRKQLFSLVIERRVIVNF